jgi:hypothetical protein
MKAKDLKKDCFFRLPDCDTFRYCKYVVDFTKEHAHDSALNGKIVIISPIDNVIVLHPDQEVII